MKIFWIFLDFQRDFWDFLNIFDGLWIFGDFLWIFDIFRIFLGFWGFRRIFGILSGIFGLLDSWDFSGFFRILGIFFINCQGYFDLLTLVDCSFVRILTFGLNFLFLIIYS